MGFGSAIDRTVMYCERTVDEEEVYYSIIIMWRLFGLKIHLEKQIFNDYKEGH